MELLQSHGKVLVIVGGIYLLLCLIRSSSRYSNPVYHRYLNAFGDLKGEQLLAEKRKWDIRFRDLIISYYLRANVFQEF